MRPHLDYGDIVYNKYDPKLHLGFNEQLEQTQYNAALAVSGALKDASRHRLFGDFGWETLYARRRYRRLCHYFSFSKSKLRITSSKKLLNTGH